MTQVGRRRNSAPAPVITPEMAFSLALMDAGGKLWTSDDTAKKRIYFNDVSFGNDFVTGYFDCTTRIWSVKNGAISGENFGVMVLAKIAAGVKF